MIDEAGFPSGLSDKERKLAMDTYNAMTMLTPVFDRFFDKKSKEGYSINHTMEILYKLGKK